METGFIKGNGCNLPKIDSLMVGSYFANNKNFYAAEFRNVKMSFPSKNRDKHHKSSHHERAHKSHGKSNGDHKRHGDRDRDHKSQKRSRDDSRDHGRSPKKAKK